MSPNTSSSSIESQCSDTGKQPENSVSLLIKGSDDELYCGTIRGQTQLKVVSLRGIFAKSRRNVRRDTAHPDHLCHLYDWHVVQVTPKGLKESGPPMFLDHRSKYDRSCDHIELEKRANSIWKQGSLSDTDRVENWLSNEQGLGNDLESLSAAEMAQLNKIHDKEGKERMACILNIVDWRTDRLRLYGGTEGSWARLLRVCGDDLNTALAHRLNEAFTFRATRGSKIPGDLKAARLRYLPDYLIRTVLRCKLYLMEPPTPRPSSARANLTPLLPLFKLPLKQLDSMQMAVHGAMMRHAKRHGCEPQMQMTDVEVVWSSDMNGHVPNGARAMNILDVANLYIPQIPTVVVWLPQ